MVETVGAWTEVASVDLSLNLTAEQHFADGPLHQQPMWDFSGGTPPTPGAEIVEDSALNSMMRYPTEESSSANLWSLNYDNNYNVRSDWYPTPSNFKTSGTLLASSFSLVDPDALRWRESFANDRVWEWLNAHPAEVEAGASVTVEWEGFDPTPSPTNLFGYHSNRQLIVRTKRTDSSVRYTYQLDSDGQLEVAGPSPHDVGTEFRAPATPVGGHTYTLNSAATQVASTLSQGERKPDEVLVDLDIGDLPGNGGGTLDIADDIFDSRAQVITRIEHGAPVAYTRAMQVWALPDVRAEWNRTAAYEFTATTAAPFGSAMLQYVTTFHPPRYRLRIISELAPPLTYRRTFPRHDSLAGGAARNYPPSRAVQTSNRIGGGYL